MPDEIRLPGAFVAAMLVTALASPVARRLAVRTGFYDEPVGYKRHLQATPYLGGLAVVAGFAVAATAFAGELPNLGWLLAFTAVLLAVGTVDDRVELGIALRVGIEAGAAVALWIVGLGWEVFAADAANLALTVVWVVGLANAFNLIDNLDGAAPTMGGVCAAGAGALALLRGDVALAAVAFALSGACVGFLPQNLAQPARLFLGDGGSMPIGVLVATAIMAGRGPGADWTAVLEGALLVSVPIFDTTLVVISRYRRGVDILSGGRDHVTHRLFGYLGSARHVALVIGSVQALMCGLALVLHEAAPWVVIVGVALAALAGLVLIIALEIASYRESMRGEPAG